MPKQPPPPPKTGLADQIFQRVVQHAKLTAGLKAIAHYNRDRTPSSTKKAVTKKPAPKKGITKKPAPKKAVAKKGITKKPVAVKKLPSRSHPELQAAFEKIQQNPPDHRWSLWEFGRCVASSDDSHIRRSSRVQDSKVQKDQADKVSVLCDWCNDDDNEWFYEIDEMEQMDLFTENGIHVSYENLKDFNHHRSARALLGFYTTQPLPLIGYLPSQLSQEKRAEILGSCYLVKKPRWARIDDGESPVSVESPFSESD